MADVKIVDIDSEQWNMKDQNARDRIGVVETQLGNLINTDIPKYRTWKKLGQGISQSESVSSMTIDVTDITELLFVYRTNPISTESLASAVIPLSEFKNGGLFCQMYISYVPSSAYMRFRFLNRQENKIQLSVTQSGVPNSVGVVFGR